MIGGRPDFAEHAQQGARRVQVDRRRREQPVFQLLQQVLLVFGVLLFGEAFEIGVRLQFGRQRPARPQKQVGHLLQPSRPLRGHQPWPPLLRGEILAGKGKFFEVVLHQQPGPLAVGAGCEHFQNLLALGDPGFRLRQFAAQIGQRAIGLGENRVMRVVLGGTRDAQ